MPHIRKILVPVDFSEVSKKALSYGVSLATAFEAELLVVHVVEFVTPVAYEFPPTTFDLKQDQADEISTQLEDLIPENTRKALRYRIIVKGGIAEDELFAEMRNEPADLVVMGTHGRRAFGRWLLGSVTEHMLRKIPTPLITVSQLETDQSAPSLSGGRILYATDLSPESKEGINFAYDLAKRFDAELFVLHVMLPIRWEYGSTYIPLDIAKDHDQLHQDLAKELELAVPAGARSDPSVRWEVGEGVPHEVILDFAEAKDANLIVINLHGKSWIERALLGSTAERVVRGAHRPVLSLPAMGT